MRKRKKHLRFLGHDLTKWQHNGIVSLIEMTAGRYGFHKKNVRTEDEFWAVVSLLTGFNRSPLEDFIEASMRISRDVKSKGLEWRNEKMTAISSEAVAALLPGAAPKVKSMTIPRVRQPRATKQATSHRPSVKIKTDFYNSWEWRTLRLEVIKEYGRACQCCGAAPGMKTASGDPVRICVDHIKPLSKFWEMRLDRSNLQILCDECNQGKGNWDQTDFRKPDSPDEWIIEDDGVDAALVHQLTDFTTGKLQ
jgi:5-methylcytosine-specific restriction endonuclease McrA